MSPWPARGVEYDPPWVRSRASTAALERASFWRQVEVEGPSSSAHWRWMAGSTTPRRSAYVLCRGWLPAGVQVVRDCESICCVNPAHVALRGFSDG